MQHSTAPVLFESSDDHAVAHDPVNEDWVALVGAIDEARFGVLARRYYLALSHLRSQQERPALPGATEVVAGNKQQALEGILDAMEQSKAAMTAAQSHCGAR